MADRSLFQHDGRDMLYTEWVEIAGRHPAQNRVWREHELHARRNYREQREYPKHYDLGGEA